MGEPVDLSPEANKKREKQLIRRVEGWSLGYVSGLKKATRLIEEEIRRVEMSRRRGDRP